MAYAKENELIGATVLLARELEPQPNESAYPTILFQHTALPLNQLIV
jgi:hypothetical protein